MSRTTQTWQLHEDDFITLVGVMHLGRRESFDSGDYLYRQGDRTECFHLVLRGLILVSAVREDGTEFTLEMMGQRALCGEAAAFDGLPSFTSARALQPTEVVSFHVPTVWTALPMHPSLAVALLRITASKQRIIAVRAQHLAALKPQARIAELIHRMAQQHGVQIHGATVIAVHLTHQQIASLTGTSRVTVTRVFKRLSDLGVMEVVGQAWRVPDLRRLQSAAGGL